jgi:acetolactate synthase-1/2/3 large subunit
MSEELPVVTGADDMVRRLVSRAVDTMFCITGAGNLALVDAIIRDGRIRLVYCHHEQAVVMAAQGYSRVSGKVGVALVTTGGGAANALIGVLSAQLDSVPILLVAGNESSFHCQGMSSFRAYGVQGFDAVSVYRPVTKFSARIQSTDEIGPLLADAWTLAMTDRRGVSLLDFPMDLQRRPSTPVVVPDEGPMAMESGSSLHSDAVAVAACTSALAAAHRPLVYLGNGVRDHGSREMALALIEQYNLPFLLSWSAADLIEDAHPLNMGKVGIYGDRAANILLQKSDLLLCIGTRLAIPQMGYDQEDFARFAERWVVDIDPVELTKFVGSRWHLIESDSASFLAELTVDMAGSDVQSRSEWLTECTRVWTELPREDQTGPAVETGSGYVHSCRVMEYLNSALSDNAVIVTDVGAGLLSGHYALRPKPGQRLFTSQGLGEMGFGLPAALGAFFADTSRPIICLSTDGGLMFNLQELQTARHNEIPLKLLVFNNDGYGMIRISQENLFDSRFAGIGQDSGVSFPDFADVAATFGFTHYLVDEEADFSSMITPALASSEPALVEIRMSPSQKYQPRLGTRKLPDGTLTSPPLDDLDPYLPIEDLEQLLGGRAHRRSYLSRGLPDA